MLPLPAFVNNNNSSTEWQTLEATLHAAMCVSAYQSQHERHSQVNRPAPQHRSHAVLTIPTLPHHVLQLLAEGVLLHKALYATVQPAQHQLILQPDSSKDDETLQSVLSGRLGNSSTATLLDLVGATTSLLQALMTVCARAISVTTNTLQQARDMSQSTQSTCINCLQHVLGWMPGSSTCTKDTVFVYGHMLTIPPEAAAGAATLSSCWCCRHRQPNHKNFHLWL